MDTVTMTISLQRLGLGLSFAFVLAAGLASTAFAQEEPADSIPPLKVTLDLGYLNAAGNTAVSTLSTGENLAYRAERFELIQSANVIYGRNDDATTTEQVKLGGRANFLVAKAAGVFVGAGFERNRFAGISRRFEESAGIAFRMLDRPRDTWLLELGGALNQQTSTAGIRRNYTSLRGATSLRHSFSETAFLLESFEVLPTVDNWTDTRVNNELAMIAPISGHVALKVSYLVKFDNLPEPGFRKSDRIFTSGIQVVF
jgi:putative salt-induced outer membrane protein YdiY